MKLRKDSPVSDQAPQHPIFGGGGTVGIISGENPRFPSLAGGGHEGLGRELSAMGLHAEPTTGHYGSPEQSFIVHNPTREQMEQLGHKYGQESVIFSQNGNHELIYTHGPHKGKAHTAQGYEFFDPTKTPDDYYTLLPGGKGSFRIPFNFDEPPRARVEQHELPRALGKAIRERIERYQDQLVALRKKELAKAIQQVASHQEPGVHEQAGSAHFEPGVHEKPAQTIEPEFIEQKKSQNSMEKAEMPHEQSIPCRGCKKSMNPVEVLLAGQTGMCGRCIRGSHMAKQEDMIDRANESDPKKRIKEVGATKGRRLPGDGVEEVSADGSGGKVKKNPLSKDEPTMEKAFSSKPSGVPGAPKPPQAAGAKPTMHKGDYGMTEGGRGGGKPATAAPPTPAPSATPKKPASSIRGAPIKAELSKALPMSGMGKMPKDASIQAAVDSHKAGAAPQQQQQDPRATPKPTDAYDPSQYMPVSAPKAKPISPVAAHLSKLVKPTMKSEPKDVCKACKKEPHEGEC